MSERSYRQSLVRQHDACPLSAVWTEHDQTPEWSTPEQALGSVFHAIAAEMLATMRRTDESRIPTEEALVIAHEVQARPDVPHLTHEQRATLRIMVLQFASHTWHADRIIAIEEPLAADIACPDGVVRKLTGRPDLLIGDPPGGLIIVDYKSGWAKPPEPRDGNWLRENGRPYLSERGVFQLDSYGYLAMREMPAVERVILREFHARRNLLREAYLTRDDLEHVERYLALALQRLDHALAGVLDPEPRPGAHCRWCPRPHDCPIPVTLRGGGSIDTPERALDVARRYAVVSAQRDADTTALKGYLADQPDPIDIGGGFVGWKEGKRSRSFGVHAEDPSIAITEEAAAA